MIGIPAIGSKRANQDATGLAGGLADKVQALVHAVDEIDVGMAGLVEYHARSIGDSAPGMRCAIIDTQVGFHFDDSSGGLAMHQDFAEAIARYFDDGAGVEIAI